MNLTNLSIAVTVLFVAVIGYVIWRVLMRRGDLQAPLRDLGREIDDEAHELVDKIKSRTQRGGGSGDDGG